MPAKRQLEAELLPGLDEHREAAVVERLLESDLIRRDEALSGQRFGDELAHDVADRAGTRPLSGAEGFADEKGLVNLGAAAGFGDLHEHWLRRLGCYTCKVK